MKMHKTFIAIFIALAGASMVGILMGHIQHIFTLSIALVMIVVLKNEKDDHQT